MLQQALKLHQQGRLDEAEALYREILCVEPRHFDTLQLLATVVAQNKNALEAIGLFDKALNINPCHPESLNNRGNSLRELYRFEEALASYDQAISLKPDYVDAYSNRGLALTELQRYDEALLSYEQAIALNADYAEPYYNRGNLLLALKRYDEALLSYEHSLALKPDDADVYNNRGLALTEQKRYEEALLSYDRALALHSGSVEAYSNRGNVLTELKQYDEALLSYDQALVFKPDYTRGYYNRGIVLTKLKRYEEVLSSYEHALAISPGYHFLFGMRLHTQMLMCDWKAFDNQGRQLVEKIERHEKASPPFCLLAVTDSLFVQKEAAEIFIQEKFPSDNSLPMISRRRGDEKIRIGYYSADFYDHATAFLMAELFEQHDRELFELIAFSYGPDAHDGMRKRVVAAFDRFIDVRSQSDREVALLSRELEIDIAVDLKGFTGGSRLGIFALRAAPIQVSYLGYPGTTGAEYIDYLIADRILIPESSRHVYTEKIVSLPDSYQVNDTRRCIAEKVFTREESGLPEFGFVFACFNNNFKITPEIFAGWMRILKQVEGSVLWLLEDNPKAASNLRREATERGVNADRLIFAKRLPLPEHLARHRSADLFLDTFPCNAHTTASDALWAGLPVLTLSGESFASRVAASLLNAIELPELITSRQEEYEALAIELAMSPEKLGQIRRKLEQSRLTAPLFDIQRFTRHLEEAYSAMYERYQEGLPPEHMVLLPSAQGNKPLPVKDRKPPLPGEEYHGSVVSEMVVSVAERHAVMLQAALTLHQQGRLDEAEALYREIVCLQPEHVDALQLLATIAAQRKHFAEAVSLFDQALAINPSHPLLLNNFGNALQELKRYEEAIASYDRALALNPAYAEAHFNRGVVLKELHRHDEAIESYDKAIAANPGYAEAHYNRGNAMQELKCYDEAVLCYERALAFKPGHAKSSVNLGNALQELRRYDEAILCYERALRVTPDDAELYFSLGNSLYKLKRHDEAVLSYDKSIELHPDGADAYNNRGVALKELKRYDEAMSSYDKALALQPDYADAHSNRGNLLTELRRYDEALLSYDQALVFKPDDPVISVNRGVTLHELKRYDEAALSYGKALMIKPDYDFLFGSFLHTKMLICDWNAFDSQADQLVEKIERYEKAATPFPVLALIDSPALQKEIAMIFVQGKYPAQHFPVLPRRDRHDRIRIGYYSADFHNHATAYLMAELFELHDRGKFELVAFSFGQERRGGMRERLSVAFDRFFDVQNQSDREIVQRSRDLEIDIAVDLKGFTQDSRPRIFAMRAAPIQVTYLGYPCTMGADYIDYLIADQTLIPACSQQYYTEKIASLPDSYQVNDTKRCISGRLFTREELGLPKGGFVFCCFNNNYKITPATFDGWMRILKEVPEAVLWLFEDNAKAADNLRQEAAQRGVDAERLIFAKRMRLPEHLARHRLADLFLDTFPCNAHTTASDALWAGLPLLTLRGESFAARVASSLLHAIQLPELITTTQEEYEALAIKLATNPEMLVQIRQKLQKNRLTTPLFDTQRFTRHLEEAYSAMYERYQDGLPPEHIVVKPALSTNDISLLLHDALLRHQQGFLDEAEALYREILSLQPGHFDALRLMATIAAQRKEFSVAVALFDQALKINPGHANSFNNQGVAFQELKRYDDALGCFEKALALKPDYAEAYANYGNVLQELKRADAAFVHADCAFPLKVDEALVYSNQGNEIQKSERYEEALLYYDKALALKPDYAEAHFNRAIALKKLKRYHESLLSYDKLLALKPDYAEAYSNRGNVLTALKRYHEAVLSYDRALAIKPGYARAYANRGVALQELKQYDEAIECYDKALALQPDYDFLFAESLFLKMRICDWSDVKQQVLHLCGKIERHEKVTTPFPVLAMTDSLLLQKEAALIYLGAKHAHALSLETIAKRARHDKIRIGYFSADFHNHATSYLMAELFEMHDRGSFELFAFSFGPERHDGMRERVTAAFDHFIDVRSQSDSDVVQLSRRLEIDIAVDLKGFTTDSRTGIFALRAAPIQVSYLGYPGTMGLESLDYLIADQILIPESSRQFYTEKIVYLPDTYQVNDAKRSISERVFTREELGLPETGFVFACFNNNYKINPAVFDGWMRLLGHVEGSVLWLFADNPKAADNLRQEAIKRGIERERLIFAKRIPPQEHLARHRLADLFLDTFPCNAHTTASDALWAGLPVLTLTGESFASRVAASLLHAIQLPELITSSQQEYEALAIELATNQEKLAEIRKTLELNRLKTPLFDSRLFTLNLEEAYRMMYERYQDELPPEHLVVRRGVSTFDPAPLLRSALLMHQQGRLGEAEALYHQIVQSDPEHFDALRLLAIIAVQKKRFEESLVLFDKALTIHPNHVTSLNNQGVAFQKLRRFDEALCSYDKALAVKPDYSEAFLNRGVVLQELGRFGEAVLSFDKALAGHADNARLWFHRGNVLQELKRHEEAVLSYDKAIVFNPDYAEAYSNRGIALQELMRYEEAVLSYERALTVSPNYALGYANLGNALQRLKRFDDAVLSYDNAIAFNPHYALAYSNRGVALQELKRYDEALLSYDRAVAVKIDYAEAYSNRGVTLQELKRYDEALASYERALALRPDYDFLFGMCLHTKMQMCDWRDFGNRVSRLVGNIEHREKVSTPFSLLSICDSLLLQKKAAMIYVGEPYFSPHVPAIIFRRARHDKIRIGYYSADFHDHATTYLMAELFELHDRSRFELIAFSFGPDRQDEMTRRVSAAFDHFFDVRTKSDTEIVRLSRDFEIDIAIDLKGFTQGSRIGIFALRAAPIQLSYLGYPGTMGAEYFDYLIADPTLIPESSRHGYTEKIVYLPDSYQVNDSHRHIADRVFTREECGLPEHGFVFACFNNNYKITPATFDGWMRILSSVEGSLLWLLEDNVMAANNLRKEAINRGVDAERLIFAQRMPLAEHLARHRQADLFLDTLPCNAHTTASDSLWAGLPLLTLAGESFAARVAASLLNAIQLPELITSTQEEYEALAIELATNPEKLRQIRQKLERNRLTTPLFDTPSYTRHIEAAYLAMYERYQEGLAPEHIFIMKAT
jgi:predicted O-linked N-acetylglucosamine transferase (SPINDLY family)